MSRFESIPGEGASMTRLRGRRDKDVFDALFGVCVVVAVIGLLASVLGAAGALIWSAFSVGPLGQALILPGVFVAAVGMTLMVVIVAVEEFI